MSGRIVVGYSANPAGRDAIAVGARLAAATGSILDVTTILPRGVRSVIKAPTPGRHRGLGEQARRAIARAIDRVPADVVAHAHVHLADSFAEGLIAVAGALGASHIVVGAADGSLRGKHQLGSTTTDLLYTSDVPVVLVPRGARRVSAGVGIDRLTVAVGTRPGADALVEDAAALSAATGARIRLLSLMTVDLPTEADTDTIRLAGSTAPGDVLAAARTSLPDGLVDEVVVAEGASIEEAVSRIHWEPGEMLLAGSSRMAQPRRLFLGSTIGRMLRDVPVPVIVVPRTRR